jgi:hypothetical protein
MSSGIESGMHYGANHADQVHQKDVAGVRSVSGRRHYTVLTALNII